MVFERPHRVPREARLSWQKGVVTKATEAQLEPPRASDRAPATAAVVYYAAAAIVAVVFVVRR